MKVGFIGAGGIAGAHAAALGEIPGVELGVIADIDGARAEAFAAKHHARSATTDWRQVCGSDAEVVFVCTTPDQRPEPAIAAASAGKHIFCEKPLALSAEAGQRIVSAARAAGVRMSVGYVLHYFPEFKTMHDTFASGELGRLVVCWIRRLVGGDVPQNHWLRNPDISGGITLEFFTHDLEWTRWIGGPVRTAYGRIESIQPDLKVEDTVWCQLAFDQGVAQAGTFWSSGNVGASSAGILGSEGSIVWEGGVLRKRRRGGETETIVPEKTNAMRDQDAAFLEACRAGRDPAVTGEDAVEAVRLSRAVQESSRTGVPVAVERA
jgi:myo-inositol 2-dehydrogenase/D-chiro-inositol 1-dehydrogenase